MVDSSFLRWDEELGVGFYPVVLDGQYDEAYFDRYVGYGKTEIGVRLNRLRVELVDRHIGKGPLVDIGSAACDFIKRRGKDVPTFGYEVNLQAINWLLRNNRWWDPYFVDPPHASFFDSLEHMSRPDDLVPRVQGYVFISIPIFRDRKHALSSRHFRPREHFFYFTRDGLVRWMKLQRFKLVEENRMETEAGREDIGTFVFVKGDYHAGRQGQGESKEAETPRTG